MLQIQRASAGSGKTYTLAKEFILHLLASKDEDGKWHLRSFKEIDETLGKILAITFTNKATNEMKERIVAKLAELGKASSSDLTPEEILGIDYLSDFQKIIGVSYNSIARNAEYALKVILDNYSRFHISTIDSFFQEILRTFAYEVNLNDSYQLEIDSDNISTAALDSTLYDFMRQDATNHNLKFWLKVLMQREAQKSSRWNVFSKSKKSVYAEIKKALRQLDNESFKFYKDELADYFSSPEAPIEVQNFYNVLKKKGIEERTKALQEILRLENKISEQLSSGLFPLNWFNKNFLSQLPKIHNLGINSTLNFKFEFAFKNNSVFNKSYRNDFTSCFDLQALDMYTRLNDWNTPEKFPYFTAWKIYGELLPYFGIMLEVSQRQSEILTDENIIKLSDTSELLKRIISEDEVPFIYERLGSYIENYLIDEFQDTSGMQWDVIKPLIRESESVGYDSLIIGDPKQSIYRFRNANHKLILKDVPAAFPLHKAAGMSKEENTNHRSSRYIVEFNNYFFYCISRLLDKYSKEKGGGEDFSELYANVIQYPKKRDKEGFVEIKFFNCSSSDISEDFSAEERVDNLSEESQWDNYEQQMFPALLSRISELIARGYRQKDICVLVVKNSSGSKIIDAIVKHNSILKGNEEPISFVSEESLLLATSPAIELIISIFEKIASGVTGHRDSHDSSQQGKTIDWNSIKSDFMIFCGTHPHLSGIEAIETFIDQGNDDAFLQSLLNEAETPSLSAIVEIIARDLLTDEERKSQAIYLSALQDAINENSLTVGNDAASFMEWWHAKGKTLSISSPEDVDAVNIMTIHKSKGLEFKCVLVPYASESFLPSSILSEWCWVKPVINLNVNGIPPCLPIKTGSNLEGTWHQDIYRTHIDQVITDTINKFYVAFTRAKNELYIYCKDPSRKGPYLNHYLKDLPEFQSNPLLAVSQENDSLLDPSLIQYSADNNTITIGKEFSAEEIAEKEMKASGSKSVEKTYDNIRISKYYVRKHIPNLKFKVAENSDFED